jgi:phosphoglycerol transferase MdoB-like AlkP superfamily enzyme
VLSEAFSELSQNEVFDFEGFVDPLENYKQLKEESYHGTIVVPRVGGGTADTEFDILTGLSSVNYSNQPYSYTLLNRPFPSLAGAARGMGYRTVAIHPYNDWYYNRNNAYRHMGFDPFVSILDFDTGDVKGGFITEAQTIDVTIDMFSRHISKNPGTPLFELVVTIQNHAGFNNKYGITETLFNLTKDTGLSANNMNSLSNYFHGLADSDFELRRLVDYLQACSEPVVVLYFGDHQPAFTPGVYEALMPETGDPAYDAIRLNTVPFIIWENDAYKDAKAKGGQSGAYPTPSPQDMGVFSANYLGVKFFSMLGFGGIDPYFDFCVGLMEDYPIILENRYIDRQNSIHELSMDDDHELNLYRSWGYYLLTH